MNRRDFLKKVGYVAASIAYAFNCSKQAGGKESSEKDCYYNEHGKAYLKARIGDGMFSDENSAVIEGYYNKKTVLTSGFFEKEHIKNCRLEVEMLQEKEDAVFIKLPGRTMEPPGDKGYLTVKKDDLVYESADNCYECASFVNIRDGKTDYGLCCRLDDCGGEPYVVRKKQKRCIFGSPDKKLSLEEIRQRDKDELKNHEKFLRVLEHARKIMESWPKWKQEIKF